MDIPKGATKFRSTVTSADASGGLTIQAATTGQSIYLVDLVMSVDTEANYQIEDEDSTAVMEQLYLGANGGLAKTFGIPLVLTVSKALQVTASASGNISVTATGYTI